MKRLGLFALVAVAACGPPPNILPVDDLNRPTDVAFMCFGAFTGTDGALHVSGRPMRACHPQNQYDPGPTSTTRTFAFLPNSAAGTLSVVDADHWKLVDLDLDTAGYGTAPLGQLPSQISASDDGCRLISANRGSCDLTVVDPSVLVSPVFSSQNGVDVAPVSPRTGTETFRPIKEDGTQLLAAPYEAVFLPQDTTSLLSYPSSDPSIPPSNAPQIGPVSLPLLPDQTATCGDNPAVDPVNGPSNPSGSKSWYALVTYPSCDLIVLIELPSGKIVDSAKVSSVDGTLDGQSVKTVQLTPTGPSPVCPLSAGDCVGQVIPVQASVSDAAAADGARHAAPGDASADAGNPDAAAGTGGAPGTGGSTASGGTPGTGGATTGTGGATGSSDAGATGGTPGGATLGNQFPAVPVYVGSPIGPSGIAIVPDGSRAYISLANASYVLSIGLSSAGLSVSTKPITLHEGARGSTRVRLNVDPNRAKTVGTAGVFAGDDPGWNTEVPGPTNFAGLGLGRKYLYVIARDGTVRVVDVAGNPGTESECETNADPLHLPSPLQITDNCLPVSPSYRRPFSVGPGIHFPSLPIDIAAADLQDPTAILNEQSVNGAHAWVITDSGIIYLVNINPVLRNYTAWTFDAAMGAYVENPSVTEPFPPVNTLRDRNEITFAVTLDPSMGAPRVDAPPPVPATGPYVEPVWTRGSAWNATAQSGAYLQTFVFFPQIPNSDSKDPVIDRRGITPQTWTVAWEGALSGNRNTGKALPVPAPGQPFGGFAPGVSWPNPIPGVDSPFGDGGGNYCQIGVVPGDMITLTGCTTNQQCGIGEVCVTGDSGSSTAGLAVTGICLDPNRAGAQSATCGEFLNSLRRYEIVAASPSNVVMRPHLDEIVLSSLTPECTPASSGSADGGAVGAGADGGSHGDSCPDTLEDPTTEGFTCESHYPGGGGAGRCLETCSTDSQCRAGRVCVDFGVGKVGGQTCDDPSGRCSGDVRVAGGADAAAVATCGDKDHRCFCADAPVFNDAGKACFDQLVNYQVVAGKSFTVVGSQTGIITTVGTQGDGTCNPNPSSDPNFDPRFSFRIPINGVNARECSSSILPPNITTIDSRVDPDFAADAGAEAAGNAQALQTLATSTPTPSDPCLYRGGPVAGAPSSNAMADGGVLPTHVRALFQNAQLSFLFANIDRGPTFQFATTFDVHGGFSPQLVQDPATIQVSMPARIVIGPVDSLAQVMSGTATPTYEAPYLFVVDQRRLGGGQGGGPTRGQLLRINPFSYPSTVGSATGYQPIFEDYNATGGLFPIQ